jgi:hypothetical protein
MSERETRSTAGPARRAPTDLLEEENLAKRALRVGGVLKRVEDLLQRDGLARLLVNRFPHNAIGLPSRKAVSQFPPSSFFPRKKKDFLLFVFVFFSSLTP